MRILVASTLLVASPAAAQTIGSLEEHARQLTYGVPGSAYGNHLHVLPAPGDDDPTLLISAELETTQVGVQAGAIYALERPGANDPAELTGTFFDGGEVAVRRLGRAIATGDFDGNGLIDIAYGGNDRRTIFNIDHGSVFVRWGDGTPQGRFQMIATQSDAFGGALGDDLSVADLNGDGIDDLVAGNSRAFTGIASEVSRVRIFYGTDAVGPSAPEPDLPPWPAVILEDVAGAVGMTVTADVDWNCDDRPDLLLGGFHGALYLLLNPEGGPTVDPGWPENSVVRSPNHFWIEILGGLAAANLSAKQVDDLTGDGCADVLLGLSEASNGRGEVVLIDGRSTAEWGPSESSKELEEIAWIRRRGALPGSATGYDVEVVHWLPVPDGIDTFIKPDLLVSAPFAVSDALDFEPTGRLIFVPGESIFGPHGEAVPKDPPGTLPIDHPRVEDLSPFVFEGTTVGLTLGWDMVTWMDIDNDGDGGPGPADVVVSAPGYLLDPDQTTSPEGGLFLIESSLFIDNDGDGAAPYEDCDDGDPEVFPGAEEICDGEDNDCNDVADAGNPGVDTETDQDADGISLCEGDCDDTVRTTSPEAEELCNGVDDDCDGRVDELWDADQDGAPDASAPDCFELAEAGGGDCDDTDPAVHPAAGDGPGFRDTDCDGVTQWAGGCSCSTVRAEPPEVAGPALVLLALGSLAARRRRDQT